MVLKTVKKKKDSRVKGRSIDKAVLHVKFSSNNTIANLTDANGNTLFIASGGTDNKFKNARKSSPIAGIAAIINVLSRAIEMKIHVIHVFLKGFSMAREDVMQEVAAQHSSNPISDKKVFIQTLKDITPKGFPGTRRKKARRL